ncbi:MAG: methyltransferase domain-containing protein [Candidatus Nanohalobium sp.]
MSYVYFLAGENLELAERELKGFLKSKDIEEEPSREGRIAFTESEPDQLKRLALTHEVTEKLARTTLEKLETDYRPKGSFAVRAKDLTDRDRKEEVEKRLGKKLSTEENTVDLERPDETVKAYILEDEVVIGKLVLDIDRGLFEKRKNQERPFSSPVSLDPVLARVLVNLSEASAGETVLDPFCGTGGILIEAGLCGIGVLGLDIKEEMVKGARENLEEYGIIAHDIRQEEASDALEVFGNEFSAVITDLPYGKASKMTGEYLDDFEEILEEFEGKKVFMWNEDEFRGYEADFSVYIHKNLTRYIFIVD